MDESLTQALFSGEPAGQPGKQSAGEQIAPATSEAQSSQPGPLTLDQIRQLIREENEAIQRKNQSQADRLRDSVQKVMDKTLKGMQAAGIQPDKTQVEAMRAAITQEESSAIHSEATSTATPGQAKPNAAPQANTGPDWRIQTRDELYQKHGIRLEKEDPEVASIDSSSPAKLALTLDAALNAKAERLRNAAAGRLPVVPIGGKTPPIHSGLNATQTLDQYYAKKFGG